MPTEALIYTNLNVSDGGADIRHVILIFLSELILTYRYLLNLQRLFLKLCGECNKRIYRSGGGSECKWWNNRRGWNRSTLSYMHPVKKNAIDINRGCNIFFTREVKFEKFKKTGDKYPKRKIPIWDQQMFREHEINNEFGNIDSNAFHKASRPPGVATLS